MNKTKKTSKKLQTSHLNEDELRSVSATWTPKQWEDYLVKNVEGSSSYQREALVLPEIYDLLCEELPEEKETEQVHFSEETAASIRKQCCNHLSETQQRIIKLAFWDEQPDQEVADIMGISRSSVRTQKHRAIRKLRRVLGGVSPDFPKSIEVAISDKSEATDSEGKTL